MTGRHPINFADVKSALEQMRSLPLTYQRALVEAVEAAHDLFLLEYLDPAIESDRRMQAALARFSFEDTP